MIDELDGLPIHFFAVGFIVARAGRLEFPIGNCFWSAPRTLDQRYVRFSFT